VDIQNQGYAPTSFPLAVLSLTKLTSLSLRRALLFELPAGIGKLTALAHLDLGFNLLATLPAELSDCRGLLQRSGVLLLDENPLHTPPREIVSRGTTAVMAYLKGMKGGASAVYKTKMMFVGLGGVGKTALANALQGKDYDAHSGTSTDGIDISPYSISISKKHVNNAIAHAQKKLAAEKKEKSKDLGNRLKPAAGLTMTWNMWDFAGQDVYYTTHQFFLSHRAVYLVVWNVRLGLDHSGVDYWLSSIATHAPNAPVIVVGTRVDEVPMPDLPERQLRARHPQVLEFVGVSARTGQGIPELRALLMRVSLWLNVGEEHDSTVIRTVSR
jgi:small GTP-binding protein